MRPLCALGVALLLLPTLIPTGQAQQDPAKRVFVEGEVSQEHGTLPDDLVVEAYDLRNHMRVDQALVRRDGRFQFRNLPTGDYWIRIVNLRGDVLGEDLASVHENRGPLSLRIRAQDGIRPPEGVVSVGKMLHPIPDKAEKEFRRSQKALSAGQAEESLKHLERAVQISPNYVEAHNNLGARYLMLGQQEEAIKEFQKTIALDPALAKAHSNLSVALMMRHRYPEAEAAARRALELEPGSAPPSYVLGQALTLQQKNIPEALENLRKSARQYPKAHLVIAQLLVRQGAMEEAANELREYLRSGNPEQKQQVESWLTRLEVSRSAAPN